MTWDTSLAVTKLQGFFFVVVKMANTRPAFLSKLAWESHETDDCKAGILYWVGATKRSFSNVWRHF